MLNDVRISSVSRASGQSDCQLLKEGLASHWFAFTNPTLKLIIQSTQTPFRQRLPSMGESLSFFAGFPKRYILKGGWIVWKNSHKFLSWCSLRKSLSRFHLCLLLEICHNGCNLWAPTFYRPLQWLNAPFSCIESCVRSLSIQDWYMIFGGQVPAVPLQCAKKPALINLFQLQISSEILHSSVKNCSGMFLISHSTIHCNKY